MWNFVKRNGIVAGVSVIAIAGLLWAQSAEFGVTIFGPLEIRGTDTPGSRLGHCVNSFQVMSHRSPAGDGARDETEFLYIWFDRDYRIRVATAGAFPDSVSPGATSRKVDLTRCVEMDDASGVTAIPSKNLESN